MLVTLIVVIKVRALFQVFFSFARLLFCCYFFAPYFKFQKGYLFGCQFLFSFTSLNCPNSLQNGHTSEAVKDNKNCWVWVRNHLGKVDHTSSPNLLPALAPAPCRFCPQQQQCQLILTPWRREQMSTQWQTAPLSHYDYHYISLVIC